ncbi:MAG: hypothetical protein ACRDA3_14025 [Peptostreptococcaceae bacterium]
MIKSYDEKLVRIRVISHTGDKISIKLPINFVKMLVKNNALDIFNNSDDIIDSKKLLNLLIRAFDYNLSGEVAYIERKSGDTIRIIID